jgi:hypothetical protein
MVRYWVMGLPPGSSGLCILQRFVCGGSRVVREWPGNPGSGGASPYHLERRSMLRAILVVVVVLDLLWESTEGVNRNRAKLNFKIALSAKSLLY